MMPFQILKKTFVYENAKRVFQTWNALLAVPLGIKVRFQVIGKVGIGDHGDHGCSCSSRTWSFDANHQSCKASKTRSKLLNSVPISLLPNFSKVVIRTFNCDE